MARNVTRGRLPGSHFSRPSSRLRSLFSLYNALTKTTRTYTEIADGTHFLQFEANRDSLYEIVRNFHDRIGHTH